MSLIDQLIEKLNDQEGLIQFGEGSLIDPKMLGINMSHSYKLLGLLENTTIEEASERIAADILHDLSRLKNKDLSKYEIRYEIVEKG